MKHETRLGGVGVIVVVGVVGVVAVVVVVVVAVAVVGVGERAPLLTTMRRPSLRSPHISAELQNFAEAKHKKRFHVQ